MQRFLEVIGDFAGRTWISVKAWIYFSSNYRIRHQTLEYHFLWNQKTDIMNEFWKMWSASNARARISGCLYQHYLFCSAVHKCSAFINSIFIDSARFVEWEHFIIPYQTSSSLINVFIKYFYIQILIAADNSKKMPQNFISCRASLEEWFPGQKMPRLNESEAKRHGWVVGLAQWWLDTMMVFPSLNGSTIHTIKIHSWLDNAPGHSPPLWHWPCVLLFLSSYYRCVIITAKEEQPGGFSTDL